ncbi:hypothetical protein MRX96_045120 [Rhipicephalus microplus]
MITSSLKHSGDAASATVVDMHRHYTGLPSNRHHERKAWKSSKRAAKGRWTVEGCAHYCCIRHDSRGLQGLCPPLCRLGTTMMKAPLAWEGLGHGRSTRTGELRGTDSAGASAVCALEVCFASAASSKLAVSSSSRPEQ